MGSGDGPTFWIDTEHAVLIRNAQIGEQGLADVRVAVGRISAIGKLNPLGGEVVFDASNGALLPGLHDHHIHMAALAAKQASVACGPPAVIDETALAVALQASGVGWLRGIGYHECVAGILDANTLDLMVPNRPVRIQHRSGRMWFLNSLALNALLEKSAPPPGMERDGSGFTGRLFDEDAWLRGTLVSTPPCFDAVSAQLAAMGITGLTDMSPANDVVMAQHFWAQQKAGRLLQSCILAGTLELADASFGAALHLGHAKLHLHEAAMPDLEKTINFIKAAHDQGRCIAVHCTTETELVFALAVIEDAGVLRGDRIEHAGVAPDGLVAEIRRLGLWVVSQPHFITERGDQYAQDVDAREVPWLYRLRAFTDVGVALAAGSDAPFGSPDPWAAMASAVSRTTGSGLRLGAEEALTPEEALALYLSDPMDLTRQRRIEVGAVADFCLLDRPWEVARKRLSASDVRMTIGGGRIIHNRVDQSPA